MAADPTEFALLVPQSFERAILSTQKFLTAFAISDNDEKVFDLAQTRLAPGFEPLDNSAHYA